MTETTTPVSAAELLAYLLTQYERAVSIHAQVRMDTDEDRRLHADAVAALRRAAEPVARYLDRAAREPLPVADILAGQGPASLYVDEHGAVRYRAASGRNAVIPAGWDPVDDDEWAALNAALEHLAATLPHVAAEEDK